MNFLDQFKSARARSVPLIEIRGPDPAATIAGIKAAVKNGKSIPMIQWDVVRGFSSIRPGEPDESLDLATIQEMGGAEQLNLTEALNSALFRLPSQSILFIHNAQKFVGVADQPGVDQAIWNCRDPFKSPRRTLILLGPGMTLPPSLQNDVLVLDEPYPSEKDLGQILDNCYGAAREQDEKVPELTDEIRKKAVRAVAGLAAFPAEQAVAMATSRKGLDLDHLWERKRKSVEGIPGTSIWRGGETFKDVVGCANIKNYLTRLINGRQQISEIFFMDEIEKMVAGEGDTSGVSQAMNEAFLTWSQNSNVMGIIMTGIPGAGKSYTAKAAAGEAGVPCLMASLSGIKGPHVGESEANVRALFKTADAIGVGGRILMIATCNRFSAITPEMQSRFRQGVFFYDWPSDEENKALWDMYVQKFKLDSTEPYPESPKWVGREIEATCDRAWTMNTTLAEAAQYVVPVATSRKVEMDRLRSQAAGRFLSASYQGIFKADQQTAPVPTTEISGVRQFELND